MKYYLVMLAIILVLSFIFEVLKNNMMKLQPIFCYFFVLFLICSSCKKELEPQESSIASAPSTTNNTSPTTSEQPQTITQPPSAQNIPVVNGINPEHGAPGHRCDIAVGAPLSGTAATPATTQPPATPVTQQMKVTVPAPTTKNTVTAKGMNPAHGQPGHRCDIAVGAPLNSAPTQPTVQPSTTTSEVAAPAPQSPNLITAPGMNPPHGQEGHVCSVAVGAPLPKT